MDPNRCFCRISEGASQPSTNLGSCLERTWETGLHWSQCREASRCRLCQRLLAGCTSPPGLQSCGNHAAVQSVVQMKALIIPISKNRLMLSGRRTYAEVGVLRLPADVLHTILVTVSQDLPASSSPSAGLPAPWGRGKRAPQTSSQAHAELGDRLVRHPARVDVGWLGSIPV